MVERTFQRYLLFISVRWQNARDQEAGVRKKTKAEAFSECPGKGAIMAKGSVLNMLTCFFGFGFITC